MPLWEIGQEGLNDNLGETPYWLYDSRFVNYHLLMKRQKVIYIVPDVLMLYHLCFYKRVMLPPNNYPRTSSLWCKVKTLGSHRKAIGKTNRYGNVSYEKSKYTIQNDISSKIP